MPLPCRQMLSVWMPQHQPCICSLLTLLLQQGQGRDTPQQGVVQIRPHISSRYAVSCSSHVISALGRTVGSQCQSKAVITLSSVRAHRDRDYCSKHNGPTAVSNLLPHWPLSCFYEADPEPFNIFFGPQTNQGGEQWIIPSQDNFSAIN